MSLSKKSWLTEISVVGKKNCLTDEEINKLKTAIKSCMARKDIFPSITVPEFELLTEKVLIIRFDDHESYIPCYEKGRLIVNFETES